MFVPFGAETRIFLRNKFNATVADALNLSVPKTAEMFLDMQYEVFNQGKFQRFVRTQWWEMIGEMSNIFAGLWNKFRNDDIEHWISTPMG